MNALYARVSTIDKGQDTEIQLSDLRAYAQARGWVFQEYVDSGVSGSKGNRPALNQLLTDCRKGKIQTVLVWKLDRFSRSLKHLLTVLEELRSLNVGFVSFKESLDFTTPTGRLMFAIVGAFAEFERDIIRERVKAGLENAKRKGKRLGARPKAIDLNLIRRLRGEGKSIREIGKVLGVSHTTIQRILRQKGAA